MQNGKLSIRLSLWLLIVVACSIAATYCAMHAPTSLLWLIPICSIGFVAVFKIYHLLSETPRKLSFFLDALENNDSMIHFSEHARDKQTRHLHQSLNRVNALILEAKAKHKEQEQYLAILLEQVATGLFVADDAGHILLANTAAKQILNYEFLNHIDQLKRVDTSLYEAVCKLTSGASKQIVKSQDKAGMRQIALWATSFTSKGSQLRIIAAHDITHEMEAKELESWNKLIHVLTHEIMNSIGPISSLSETLLSFYDEEQQPLSAPQTAKSIKGLTVINERCKGLINFVHSYRKLSKLAPPIYTEIHFQDFFSHLLLMHEGELNNAQIRTNLAVAPSTLTVTADAAQLSQLFINLLNNAITALQNSPNPTINIEAKQRADRRIEIVFEDNGSGIDPTIADQIFIPFFTTKEQGSGIGLSLSRQIIRNHGGTIELSSQQGSTRFIITL